MRDRCDSCQAGRLLTYVTRRFANHTVRYRRCSHCRTTDKTVQMIFDNRTESSTNHPRSASHVNLKFTADEQFDEPNGDKKWLR